MSPALLSSSPRSLNANGCIQDPLENQYQKGVLHLSEIGIKNVPRKYVFPVSERPEMNLKKGKSSSHKGDGNLHLPIIDVAELQGPRRAEALKALSSACENYGFFQVVNHGVPVEAISNMMDAAKRFFALPTSEKEKYMSPDLSKAVRYGTSFNQLRDRVFCWRDFLKFVCHPLEDVISDWPSSPVDFRELAVTYAKETKMLFHTIADAVLESLGLSNARMTTDDQDDETLKEIKNGGQSMIINYYPSCPEPDLTIGLRPHSDFGVLTLLLQDEVPGLQIKHQGKWFTVEPIPGSFVINVGDQLEVLFSLS
ncbi:OLC1v1034411C1 [Oldenlandia corymbosa var. corymbosa]|uniref:OLC1v1034411C1 n=1 Tax=Oldenlandia corymbosa var. corymbosa TaxID=529605 RepID=A0AAV1CRC3_OLDCO|nr:OLC1v1034411C1 [Oldenlandia corymbosa var. corymbosa]